MSKVSKIGHQTEYLLQFILLFCRFGSVGSGVRIQYNSTFTSLENTSKSASYRSNSFELDNEDQAQMFSEMDSTSKRIF